MNKITIQTVHKVMPMIYCYTTPEIARHVGWVKIGYTEKQTTEERQKQQSHTVDVIVHEEWKGNAVFDDGSGEIFHDTDFHSYLSKKGIERTKGTEWFHIKPQLAKNNFNDFRENRGILKKLGGVTSYTLREEQQKAVIDTKEYAKNHKNGAYLWNAKPRFGKTLSAYDFCKSIDAKKVLIVTNRPAIANSWYSDYEQFLGTESGYSFVSDTDTLKGKPLCISYKKYIEGVTSEIIKQDKLIEFVSLQDLKGSIYFGGEYDKLQELSKIDWDILIIDEATKGLIHIKQMLLLTT